MAGYLILGANGFIGSHVMARLSSRASVEVTGAARRPAPGELHGTARWLEFDAVSASVGEIADVLRDVSPRVVVNCIGSVRGEAEELFDVNARFVTTLIEALACSRNPSLIHLGSAAEYGMQPRGRPITERADLAPIGDYGASKAAGTAVVAAAIERREINGRVLRVFNPLGAGSPPTAVAGRAARTIADALAGHRLQIDMGDLSGYRDFIDVRDVARVIERAAAPGVARGSVLLNVGRGEAVSVRTLISHLAGIAGYFGEIRERPRATATSLGEVPWQQASTMQLRRELRWSPAYSLDDALGDLWRSLRSHLRAPDPMW